MIIKLIMPKRKNFKQEQEKMDGIFYSVMNGEKRVGGVMSSLPILAGMTPGGNKIIIEDENVEEINFDSRVDLVGISANTSIIERAYEIADIFRKKKVVVVLGGVHPSVMPEEALEHADAVAIGEGEHIWSEIIKDLKNKKLKKQYKADKKLLSFKGCAERYDLLNNKKYLFHNYQTARGCPYSCYFCSIQTYLGKKYRAKNIEQVIRDVKRLKAIENKLIFFCDDNFVVDSARTKELIRKLIPLNIRYAIQARIDIYEDSELLDLLQLSGCVNILVGFESVIKKNLIEMKKDYDVDLYHEGVEKIQKRGLFITGSFIFGFDNDDISVFRRTLDFIKISDIGCYAFNILTPFPGTAFYERFHKEGRLLHKDWTKYDCRHVCFRPKHMKPEELYNGYLWSFQKAFEMDILYKRVIKLYKLWNMQGNDVYRYRRYPLLTNLASHNVAYSYPIIREVTENIHKKHDY